MIAYILLALAATAHARPKSISMGVSSGPTLGSQECPPTGHHLLQHEYDCTKFYYCEYGVKWETPRDCAPGTEFSFDLQVCIHPAQANCNLPGTPEPETVAPETEATTSAPSSTEASIISTTTTTTTTAAPETVAPETEAPETEATTSAPSSTEASIISTTTTTTTTAAPETVAPETEAPETEAPETEAPETEATTSAPSSTEASIISTTTTTAAPETVAPETEAPETEAPETEAPETEATTSAPSSTEASIISTTTTTTTTAAPETVAPETEAPETEAPETEAPETEATTSAPSSTEASIISTTTTTAAPETDAPETEATTSAPSSTEASIVSTTESNTGLLPNGCPADFDVHQLLPHEENCDQFYYCNFGEKVLRDCAPGTHFNPTLQVCDWPENAGCANSGTEDGEDTYTTSAATETEEPATEATTSAPGSTEASIVSTTESETGLLPNGCPADFDVHQLLPHEENCDQFYYCNFGEKVLRDCAPGTHFNPTLQVCDWPENAGCANSGTEEPATEATTSAPGSTEASIVSTTESDTGLLPNGCPADFDVHQLLPHEENCDQFYYCNFGEKVLRDCAPGTHFNPTLQVCDWPENAGCANSGTEDGEDTSTTTAATETEGTTSAPSSTEASIVSTTSTTTAAPETEVTETEATTSAPGSTEASIVSTTAAPETDIELLPNGCPADFSVHQLLPHEVNCDQFYYCKFGEKVLRDCAPGTHFNPTLQVCDWPENAGCANSGTEDGEDTFTTTAATETEGTTSAPSSTEASIVSTTSTTTAAPETEVTETEATTSAPGSTEASIVSTTAAPETDIELLPNGCPADFSVHQLLPHEENCDQFYYCNFGEKVLRDCAPGTHFNPTLQVCDWPENAGCANSGTEDGEDTSTTTAATETEATTSAPSSTEASIVSTTSTTTAAPETEVTETETTTSAPSSTEASIVSTTAAPETDIELLPNGCPADFSVHQLLPHEENCDQFYYCKFGEKVLRDCAPGTHFNPTLQVCDWPENAGCANSGTEDGEDTSTTTAATETEATTSAPSSTEASIVSTTSTTTAAPETEVTETETTTSAPSSTEASIVSTTAAPETDIELLPNGCPADFSVHQLLPHEENCDQFYYCNFGEKVLRDCAPGTHFNPTLQVCDWPENAGCANSGTEDGEDTSTTAAATETEATTSAPSSTEASIVSTTSTTTAAPETEVTETEATTSAPGSTEASIVSTTAAPETDIELLPNGCPADFSVHQLLPHEENCDQFYYCNFGEKVLRDCAPGTHFNPTLQVCDWPENAGCANSGTEDGEDTSTTAAATETEATTSAPSSTEASIVSTTSTTTAAPETEVTETEATTSAPGSTEASIVSTTAAPETDIELLPNGCPADFSVHQLLPHEENCDQFYYCNFGEKVLRDCAPGTHFNPTLQVCDWPENAGCANSGTEDGEDTSTTTAATETEATTSAPSSTEASIVSTTSTTTAAPETEVTETEATTSAPGSTEASIVSTTAAPETDIELLPNGCPADFSVHQLLPHEENCDQFYYCKFGEKVLRDCAPGTFFNPTLQVCDWPENVNCTNSGGGEDIEDGNGDNGEDAEDGSDDNGEDAEDGSGDNGEDVEDGSGDNAETDGSQNDKCSESCNVTPWAHETDCDKFWRCDGEKAVLTVCSEGLHFNDSTKTCDFICNASCVRDNAQTTLSRDGVRIFLPWDHMDADLLAKAKQNSSH